MGGAIYTEPLAIDPLGEFSHQPKSNVSIRLGLLRSIMVLGLSLVIGCHSHPTRALPPVSVKTVVVNPQTIPADFQFVGVAKSSHPVEIRARVEGYLQTIDYVEGSLVQANDLLFTLDPSQFEDSLEMAKAELAKQHAILWGAQRELARLEPLYEKNAASQKDRDNSYASVLAAEAQVLAAEANVKQAELNLSYTFIRSPIKGLTARAAFREGTLITPNANGLLTQVSVIDPIWVVFNISDSELLAAQSEGKAAQIILPKQQDFTVSLQLADGSSFPHKGSVNFTAPTLDPETGSLVIRATLPNPNHEVLPGQFVTVWVSGATRPNAMIVPQTAVFQSDKGMAVFIVQSDNTVVSKQVEVGDPYHDFWIIKQGLNPGDQVVVEGVNKIKNGSTVQVVSRNGEVEAEK